jgi:hypothetical protein
MIVYNYTYIAAVIMIDYTSANINVPIECQSRKGCDPAIKTIWKLYLQVGDYSFPLVGTVQLEAQYKSSPAALGEPRVGVGARLVSLTKRSRGGDEDISSICIDFRSQSLFLSTATSLNAEDRQMIKAM